MKVKINRIIPLILAALMLIGVGMMSFADDTVQPQTIWNGDKVSVDVKAGSNGYTFMSVYKKPYHAYEMSNHMVSVNGVDHDIPQSLIIVEANKDYTWIPSGLYSFENSNYEVLYCCDAVTGYDDNIYYKRLNLEDSDYYDEESAAHIRGIVTNSYPYVSLEQMKKNLAADGFEGADKLTRAEIITAVQAAIWAYANVDCGEYYYSRTFDVPTNSQWGGVMHDFTAEMNVWWQTGKRKFSTDETVGARINALIDYLKAQDKIYAEKEQIVISQLKVVNFAPVMAKDGVFTVAIQVALNNSGSSSIDDIKLDVYVDDELVKSEKVVLGTELYGISVEAKPGQTIKTVVSGKQTLPKGVYFYEPEGGRDVSQCVVGVAAGETDVYAQATIIPELPEEKPVTGTLDLQKINWKGEALTGAEFDLYLSINGTSLKVGSYAVDENGKLKVENLVPGSYELVEATAPTGFVKPTETLKFTIGEEDGKLTLEGSSYAFVDEQGTVVVENRLNPTKVSLSGVKYLDEEVAKDFSFTISYAGEVIKTVVSAEDGIFDFGEFFFDEEGEYVFTIVEVIGNDENIYYDESVYTVKVTVTEADLVLSTEVTVLKDGEAHEGEIRFDNFTTPDIPDNPPPLDPPKTGDSTAALVLFAIAALSVAVALFGKKRLA